METWGTCCPRIDAQHTPAPLRPKPRADRPGELAGDQDGRSMRVGQQAVQLVDVGDGPSEGSEGGSYRWWMTLEDICDVPIAGSERRAALK
jgi:hypothetical protein